MKCLLHREKNPAKNGEKGENRKSEMLSPKINRLVV